MGSIFIGLSEKNHLNEIGMWLGVVWLLAEEQILGEDQTVQLLVHGGTRLSDSKIDIFSIHRFVSGKTDNSEKKTQQDDI